MNDVASEDDDPLLGEVVDERFRLDEKLGEGAVGRVYLATQLSIERSVAIKVLHGEFRRDDEYQRRFQREARAISSFNHPNIVRLVDYGEDDAKGLTYLAMEFVEGLELFDILEKGRLDPRCALEITSQVAAGLSAAHEADIVHRDLKASNIILVSVPGGIFQAKVLDFGVAFPKNQSKRMTTDGEVFGTPAYMSPEQAQGKAVDAASDIYSLGVVLFEMLTGVLPFDGENTVELMVKHLQNEPPALHEVHPAGTFPSDVQALIDDLLAKEPEDRPESGDVVRDRIESIRNANGWGNLHVDANTSLEEALSSWLLTEEDTRLTTEESTGRPGSSREMSLDSEDQQAAVDAETDAPRSELATDSPGTEPGTPGAGLSGAGTPETEPTGADGGSGKGATAEAGSPVADAEPGPSLETGRNDEAMRASTADDVETEFGVSAPGPGRSMWVLLAVGSFAVVAAGALVGYYTLGPGAGGDGASGEGFDQSNTGGTAITDVDTGTATAPDTGSVDSDVALDTSGASETDATSEPTAAESEEGADDDTPTWGSGGTGSGTSDRDRAGGSGDENEGTRGSDRTGSPSGREESGSESTATNGEPSGSGDPSNQNRDDGDDGNNDDELDRKLKDQLEDLDESEF